MVHVRGNSRFLPWIVLGGTVWAAVGWAIAPLLPGHWPSYALLSCIPLIAAAAAICMPKSSIKAEAVRFTRDWSVCLALYDLVVFLSVVALLLGCSAVGYLPYSDRPGPGWGNVPAHMPGLDEIKYFASWGILVIPMCTLSGSFLFLLTVWLGWFGVPKWLIRLSGGLIWGFLAVLATTAAGWYIAISVVPCDGAGLAAMIFGAIVLPRFSGSRGSALPPWKRASLITLATALVLALLSYPFWK